jgi:methionyl-tRNA formyltransferase
MSIVFFGTPYYAIPSLKALINTNEDIALVVTQPDRSKGRGHVVSYPPVKELALSKGLRVAQPQKMDDEEFCKQLCNICPEFIIVVAYGKILPEVILSIPAKGCLNVHASLLPKYRGAAPIQWALINGDPVTGVTTIFMDKGLDTGDILMQKRISIEEADNSETLSKKLSLLGAETLIETIKGLRHGDISRIPQSGEASYAPQLRKTDGRINWNKKAIELFNLVRGVSPWPSAYTYLKSERIKLIKVKPLIGKSLPGIITKASEGELIIGTGEDLLEIEKLQPEGKKIMTASAFLTGRKLKEKHDRLD